MAATLTFGVNAYAGSKPDWEAFFDGYSGGGGTGRALPSARKLSESVPDAPFLLSDASDEWVDDSSRPLFMAAATYLRPTPR